MRFYAIEKVMANTSSSQDCPPSTAGMNLWSYAFILKLEQYQNFRNLERREKQTLPAYTFYFRKFVVSKNTSKMQFTMYNSTFSSSWSENFLKLASSDKPAIKFS